MVIEIVSVCRRSNAAHTSFVNTALSIKYLLGVRRAFVFLKACGLPETVIFRTLLGGPRRVRVPVSFCNLEEKVSSSERWP